MSTLNTHDQDRQTIEKIAALWTDHADCDYEKTSTADVLALIKDAVEYDGELLTAANTRIAELEKLLEAMEQTLHESNARELVLREALEWIRDAADKTKSLKDVLNLCGAIAAAMPVLTSTPPPVVPKSVADELAEALLGCAARLSGSPEAPGPLENVKAIESALAAYREGTKP